MTTRPVTLALALVVSARAAAADEPVAVDPPVQEIEPEPPPVKREPRPTPAPTPTPAPHTMEEITIPKSFLRFGLNFFADASVFATTPDEPGSGFAVGTLGVRMLGELGPSVDALGELAFETTDDGPIADVEQLFVRWRRGPGTLELGRLHTDIGYWNTAYHHGLWLQTPIARPHVARFEDDGGLLPVHWIGAHYALKGKLGGGTGRLVIGVGNGRGSIVDDVLVSRDTNEAKSLLVKVRYKTPMLDVGASGIFDIIAPEAAMLRPALPDERIQEVIGNAYLVVRGAGPLLIVESYVLHHRADSRATTTYSVYGLLGFAFTDWVMPYIALDVVDGADADPYFKPDPMAAVAIDVIEGLAGVRFETSTWSALKLEVQFQSQPDDADGKDDFTVIANWSFGL